MSRRRAFAVGGVREDETACGLACLAGEDHEHG